MRTRTGNCTVNVTLSDAGGYTTSVSGTATVADAALTAGAVSVTGLTEGQAYSGAVTTFSDANPSAAAGDFNAAIDWGNGDRSAGTITGYGGTFTVSGGTTYYAAGSFPVAVTVTDADSARAASGTAPVADAALTWTAASLNATAGDALNGVAAATFTDPYTDGSSADYTATITWGDGTTSAGMVDGSDGSYAVIGSHTYAAQGSYAVGVTVTDAGGASGVTGSAQVSPAKLRRGELLLLRPEQPVLVAAGFRIHGNNQLGRRHVPDGGDGEQRRLRRLRGERPARLRRGGDVQRRRDGRGSGRPGDLPRHGRRRGGGVDGRGCSPGENRLRCPWLRSSTSTSR